MSDESSTATVAVPTLSTEIVSAVTALAQQEVAAATQALLPKAIKDQIAATNPPSSAAIRQQLLLQLLGVVNQFSGPVIAQAGFEVEDLIADVSGYIGSKINEHFGKAPVVAAPTA